MIQTIISEGARRAGRAEECRFLRRIRAEVVAAKRVMRNDVSAHLYPHVSDARTSI